MLKYFCNLSLCNTLYLSIIDLVQDQKSVDTKDDKKIKQRQKDYKKKIDCQQNDYKKRIKGRRDE